MDNFDFDFSGWATKNDVKCSDGRTIMKDAFKHNDGARVPLVYNHMHNDITAILGHAYLENRNEGVYAYCKFNDTESGQNAKLLVEHGDVDSLSIYANKLKQHGSCVIHGDIRELSLVLAGANPEAHIDNILAHGEYHEDEAIFCFDEPLDMYHSEDAQKTEDKESDDSGETVKDVFDTLTEKQKKAVYAVVGMALQDGNDEDENEDSEGGKDEMKHNVFETDEKQGNTLSHSEMMAIVDDAKRTGSLKEAFLAHATEYADKTNSYGINGWEFLYPEDHNLNPTPEFIKRETGWVSKVISGVHHTPFSRIKSMFADITEDDARAKGYIKGKYKKEEVFTLLKRSTTPTTIYKKQKMDRDDIIDIDFDAVPWIKNEMRMMLDEEIARAILIGDGRLSSSDDKISELNIRPIWKDEDLFTIKVAIEADPAATDQDRAKDLIKKVIKARKNYKGSGNPTFFTTEDMITDMLLIEDTTGRRIYNSVSDLATALRVKELVPVEVMENVSREGTGADAGYNFALAGLIVNLNDYNVGADKGGAINMFDDFDIDFNQMKYLIETRCSGALTKPFSAIAIEYKTAG